MGINKEKFQEAFGASLMKDSDIAKTMGVESVNTYKTRKEDPGQLRLNELYRMSQKFNNSAKMLLKDAVDEIFL